MTTKFNMLRDINGYNGFGLQFSDDNFKTILAANTEQHFTVPSAMTMGANGISTSALYIAIFSYDPGSSVWVANNTTAAVASGSFTNTLSQLNPTARLVKGADVLSFITANTNVNVCVSLYCIG